MNKKQPYWQRNFIRFAMYLKKSTPSAKQFARHLIKTEKALGDGGGLLGEVTRTKQVLGGRKQI